MHIIKYNKIETKEACAYCKYLMVRDDINNAILNMGYPFYCTKLTLSLYLQIKTIEGDVLDWNPMNCFCKKFEEAEKVCKNSNINLEGEDNYV